MQTKTRTIEDYVRSFLFWFVLIFVASAFYYHPYISLACSLTWGKLFEMISAENKKNTIR